MSDPAPSLRLRPAVTADLEAIAALTREAVLEGDALAVSSTELDDPAEPRRLRQRIVLASTNPSLRSLSLACRGDACVGWIETVAYARARRRHRARVTVVVARQHRRGGVGSSLLEHARDWAARHGVLALEAEVRQGNAAALALFAAQGFALEAVSRRALRLGPDRFEDLHLLTRWLDGDPPPPAAP